MGCGCNSNNTNDNTLKITIGTTYNFSVEFNEDITDFTQAIFTIRADYDSYPVINKAFDTLRRSVNISLTKQETALLANFPSCKNRANYIWGLDLINNDGIEINIFPQTGEPAPACYVYRHVVEGE